MSKIKKTKTKEISKSKPSLNLSVNNLPRNLPATTPKKASEEDLKKCLETVNKVFLLHDDEYDVEEEFQKYLQAISPQSQIEFVGLETEIKFTKKDVVFPLFTDLQKYAALLQALIKAGLSPLQIFSPSIFYFPFLIEKRGFIIKPDMSNFQMPVLATIDTINVCNLNCATCTKPSWQENGERMSFELFKKILDKLQMMGIRAVELYNFTEPFLNPEIYEFMAEVKRRGLSLGISSNLSRPHIPKLKECVDLLTPGDWFVITISGVDQKIYGINHRGGKISNVIENIKEISKSANRNIVTLRLLHFDYNVGELQAAQNLAKEYGLSFQFYPAEGDPINEPYFSRKEKENLLMSGISYYDYDRSFYPDGFYCFFIHSRNIVINHKGNVELCCNTVPRPYDLGSFLEQDISVIQMKRDMHPICRSCKYHSTGEAKSISKACPVDPVKASNILRHGMETICLERAFAPKAFIPELEGTKDFVQKAIKYFET